MIFKKPKTKKTEVKADAEDVSENGLKEIDQPKKKRKLRYLLIYLAAIGFVFYAVITIIDQSVKISEKRAELSELQQQINVVEIESNYLEKVQNFQGLRMN